MCPLRQNGSRFDYKVSKKLLNSVKLSCNWRSPHTNNKNYAREIQSLLDGSFQNSGFADMQLITWKVTILYPEYTLHSHAFYTPPPPHTSNMYIDSTCTWILPNIKQIKLNLLSLLFSFQNPLSSSFCFMLGITINICNVWFHRTCAIPGSQERSKTQFNELTIYFVTTCTDLL